MANTSDKNWDREKRPMTVEEAGHLGGEKGGHKGGETVAKKYGHEHFEEIGKKGGDKVRNLIERGKQTGR